MLNTKSKTVAIVGATGAVGVEFLRCLDEREFPLKELRLLASARSAGKQLSFKGQPLTVAELTDRSFEGVDIALFSAGSDISKKFAPAAVKADDATVYRALGLDLDVDGEVEL